MLTIKKSLTDNPKSLTPDNELGFGKIFTDHMFIMDYTEGKGWHDARIIPYQNISLSPAAMVFHYAQESFEGLKAYRSPKDGKIRLFRPEKNAERMISTHERMCIPTIPVEDFVQAVTEFVEVEERWVPYTFETSLYLRPFVIATEPHLGVKPASNYQFIIIGSPVGAYYAAGVNPIKIYVEDEYVRTSKGGTGFVKCGGNYAASIKAQVKAQELGYAQVLWLDGNERKYVEEVGSMNVFFKISGKLYTAPTVGTVLPGVTRMSVIDLARKWGIEVCETPLLIDDIMKAGHDGTLEEVFGTGTAAVISPVGELRYKDDVITINDFKIGQLTQKVYDTMTGIQWGTVEDDMGFTKIV